MSDTESISIGVGLLSVVWAIWTGIKANKRADRAETREVRREEIEALERRVHECEEDRKLLQAQILALKDRIELLERANRDLLVELAKVRGLQSDDGS